MEEEMASIVSNDGTNVMVESSDLNSSSCQIHVNKRLTRDSSILFTQFKGVVPQHNGHWGAQIYCNHKRIWLGTFKTERDAAMAYDSAAIKLRNGYCFRNFPWTNLNIEEPDFQSLYSTEAILNMIKDGSYPSSQSFVFTRGWNRFVREKQLKAKDIVTFYTRRFGRG